MKQLHRDLNEAVRLQSTLQDLLEQAEAVFNEMASNA